MKIIDNALREIEFHNLGVGATFKYGASYFIKTHKIETNCSVYNAVDLEDGNLEFFAQDDMTIPFNCELIVL